MVVRKQSPSTGVGQRPLWAALMVSMPAELRSCLIESAHLVLGRPLGLFQQWMFGLKSNTLRTGREDGMRWRCPNQHRRRCRRRDDAVACLVRSRMIWLLMCIIYSGKVVTHYISCLLFRFCLTTLSNTRQATGVTHHAIQK